MGLTDIKVPMSTLEKLIIQNGYDDKKIKKFERFFELITEYNEKFNLTAITDKRETEYKHFIDSLAALSEIQGKVLDIGAGAGFPSVPLAILREDCNFLTLDSVNKKVEFLKTVINELELKNVSAIHSRVEDLKKTHEKRFDCCVVRAVAKLNILAEYSLPYLKVNGILIAYKSGGAEEEINEAKSALFILGGKKEKILNKNYSFNGETFERNLVIIKKIKETPEKYPRGGNKPKTDPL